MSGIFRTASALPISLVMFGLGISVLHAQTKTTPAFRVTETLEMHDQAAFLNAIKAVPPTVASHGGHYIALGGKIVPGLGSPPRHIMIIEVGSLATAEA